MTSVLFRESFATEDMAKMPSAVAADDFRSHAVNVNMFGDGIFDFIVKGRPATVTGEFLVGPIQRRAAAATDVRASMFVVGVFPGEGRFCTFADQYEFLKFRQFVVLRPHFFLHFCTLV